MDAKCHWEKTTAKEMQVKDTTCLLVLKITVKPIPQLHDRVYQVQKETLKSSSTQNAAQEH